MELLTTQMEQRRDRILGAARRIVARKGVEGLTMRELARQSHVTVPTIYNLIGGKDAVLFAAVEEQVASFVAAVEARRAGSPVEGVMAVVDACVRELLHAPSYYRILMLHFFTAPAANESRVEVARALRGEFDRSLRALEEAGVLADWVDPGVLGERMRAHLSFTGVQWASGELSNEGLKAAARYDACTTLAAVAKGAARAQLERAAAEAQAAATSRGRRPVHNSRRSRK